MSRTRIALLDSLQRNEGVTNKEYIRRLQRRVKVEWQSHERGIRRFIAGLEAEKRSLKVARLSDARQTGFVLVRRGNQSNLSGKWGDRL